VIDGEVTTTDASTERTAPLAEYLRAEFTSVVASPYPGVTPAILVENDVACLAMLAFREYGYDTADLAVAAVLEDGIGGGLIMDGRLRRGHSGRAMEIGHLLVGRPPGWRAEHEGTDTDRDAAAARWVGKDDPLLCSCGMVDHVDAFATVASLRRDLEATEDDDLEAAAQRLDPHKAREILSRAGSCLGRALAHVCNVVDPGMLILYLPRELADVSGTRRTADYLEWVRIEVTQAFAVKGSRATEFNHQSLPTGKAELARLLARSAAVCLLDTVVEQALDYDEYRSDRKSVASRYEMTGAGGSSRRIPS
jgi:predicted NBD/HSP70 family sugar kinase